jgi:hypothetical protein
MPIVRAADPERGIDWERLRELVRGASDDDLREAKSAYPWSATVEIRSVLLDDVADLQSRWEAIGFHPTEPRWLELDEDEARAVSVLSGLSFLQLAGATVESS